MGLVQKVLHRRCRRLVMMLVICLRSALSEGKTGNLTRIRVESLLRFFKLILLQALELQEDIKFQEHFYSRSVLDKHQLNSANPLKYSHMDIAGSAGDLPDPTTGAPVAALTKWLLSE